MSDTDDLLSNLYSTSLNFVKKFDIFAIDFNFKSLKSDCFREQVATSNPSFANRSMRALPIPFDPPVTTTNLFMRIYLKIRFTPNDSFYYDTDVINDNIMYKKTIPITVSGDEAQVKDKKILNFAKEYMYYIIAGIVILAIAMVSCVFMVIVNATRVPPRPG